MRQIVFFSAERDDEPIPLTKHFSLKHYPGVPEPRLNVQPYPLVKELTSVAIPTPSFDAYADALTEHAELGNALLGGQLIRPIEGESRANLTDKTAGLYQLILDFDGVDAGHPDEIIRQTELRDTSYVLIRSASSGMPGKPGLRCHCCFLLERPHSEEELLRWLTATNQTVFALRDAITLNPAGMSLSWPLDPTLSQASRISYIATPTFDGVDDPHPHERVEVVRRSQEEAQLALSRLPTLAQLRDWQNETLAALRRERQLPDRRLALRAVGNTYDGETDQLITNPDTARITVADRARGFTYLNLNDGDSGAYYHPTANPKYIYNFKGEPILPTEKVNAEYYQAAKREARVAKEAEERERRREEQELFREEAYRMYSELNAESEAPVYFYLTDHSNGDYKVGVYEPSEGRLELTLRKNLQQIASFANEFGLPDPSTTGVVPSFRIIFDPRDMTIYKPPETGNQMGRVNLYCAPTYKRNALRLEPDPDCPTPTIHEIVHHVLGADAMFTERFYEWLAYIVQTGQRTNIAWLLTGTAGTGKDTVMTRIVKPVIGAQQFAVKRFDQMEDKFDYELRHVQVMFLNEASMKSMNNAKAVAERVKDMITADVLSYRGMRREAVQLPNYINLVAGSNNYDALPVDRNDRRWVVPPRQEVPLRDIMGVPSPQEVDSLEEERPLWRFGGERQFIDLHAAIRSELQDFTNFLVNYPVNPDRVQTPIDSDNKEQLKMNTISAAEQQRDTIFSGNFQMLYAALRGVEFDYGLDRQYSAYVDALDTIATALTRAYNDVSGETLEVDIRLSDRNMAALFALDVAGEWKNLNAMATRRQAMSHLGIRFRVTDGAYLADPIRFRCTRNNLREYIRTFSKKKGLHIEPTN